jgi:hypothetical protein
LVLYRFFFLKGWEDLYRNNDGFYFSSFFKIKIGAEGSVLGALTLLVVMRLVCIGDEGHVGPPYSCLNKSQKIKLAW